MKKNIILTGLLLISGIAMMTGCAGGTVGKKVGSIEDLKGATMGVQLLTTGHLFAEETYTDDEHGSEVKAFSKGAEAVAALKQGVVDAVIIDEQTANVFVSQNSELTILDEPFETEEYAICVSKDKPELLEQINAALAELKSEGTFQNIIDNYIGDNQGGTPYIPSTANTKANGVLIAATNAQFPPYEFYKNDEIVGIDAELAQAIADKLNMELKFEDMEFDTIIASVQSGKTDIGIAGMSITEERKNSVNFSEPYVNTKQVIIVKK